MKHDPAGNMDAEAARRVLIASGHHWVISRSKIMSELGMTAAEAEGAIRDLHEAGYVSRQYDRWERTSKGQRLYVDKMLPRIARREVDAIIADRKAVVDAINADPDRLHHVNLLIYGSALDPDREDYGDIDVALEFNMRILEDEDRSRIEGLLAERVMEAIKRDRMCPESMWEIRQDKHEIRKAVKGSGRSAKYFSIMDSHPIYLGTPYRVVAGADPETGRIFGALDAEIVSGGEPKETESVSEPTPDLSHTLLEPRGLFSDRKQVFRLGKNQQVCFSDCAIIEDDLWSPTMTKNGPRPKKAQRLDEKLSGFRHLCDSWKGDKKGGQIIRDTAIWATNVGLPMDFRDVVVSASKESGDTSMALSGKGDFWITSFLSRSGFESLIVNGRLWTGTITPIEAAARYAFAEGMRRCLSERGFKKSPRVEMKFTVGDLTSEQAVQDLDFSHLRKMSVPDIVPDDDFSEGPEA